MIGTHVHKNGCLFGGTIGIKVAIFYSFTTSAILVPTNNQRHLHIKHTANQQTSLQYQSSGYSETSRQVFKTGRWHRQKPAESLQYRLSVNSETSGKSSIPVIDVLRDQQTSLQYRSLMYPEISRQVFNTGRRHTQRPADKSSVSVISHYVD